MAIGDPYAVPSDLELRLNKTDNGTYTTLLDAASRAVESFTRRQFNKTATATARRFRALDPHRLPVDDFHTVTDLVVEVDGAAWDIANVDPRPPDGVVNGQTGWPFFDLFAVNRTWPHWKRRATVTVTAQWGWAAVPEAIRQATLDVAAAMFTSGSTGTGAVKAESIDGYSVSYDLGGASSSRVPPEMVRAATYRRKRFGVA